MSTITFRKSSLFRYIAYSVLTAFVSLLPVGPGWAQVSIVMPPAGQMIRVTDHFAPPQMVGLKINLKDPFSFGFIMDQGQTPMSDTVKKEEYNKIIKYFLVSLAMPNKDMWVNLSPFESKRIIPEIFGQTEMGRDLLAQDYVLKQFTASLMYPDDGLGKKFWSKVYEEGQARFGTTDINVNTFNKVWIVADHADVYQKGDTAFLVGSHLKVMLEQDFKAIEQNKEQFGEVNPQDNDASDAKTQMASQLVREIIIPAIEKEVNEGQSFAAVRQIYNAEIMATWFKKTLRESLLGQVFADKAKIAGQQVSDPQAKDKIFQQYLLAYKRGVFNFIKQEATPDGQVIPRRYLSGGMKYIPEAGPGSVNSITPQQVTLPTPTQEAAQVRNLTKEFGQAQAQGPVNYQAALEQQFVSSGVNNSTLSGLVKAATQAPVSPEISNNFIARLATNLTQPNATAPERETQAQALTDQLTKAQAQGPEVYQGVLDNLFSNPSFSSAPLAPAMARAITEMPQANAPTAAILADHLMTQPKIEVAQEVRSTGENLVSEANNQTVDEAQVTLAPAQEQTMPANTVQDHLNSVVSATRNLQDAVSSYNGPDTGILQQTSGEIQSTLTDLEGKLKDNAVQMNDKPTVEPAVLVQQINDVMPRLEAFNTTLTALQDQATDPGLKESIGNLASSVQSNMADMQQKRDNLTAQPVNSPSIAPVAMVQQSLSSLQPATELEQNLTEYQGPDANIVQQDNGAIKSSLDALQQQEENLTAMLQNPPSATTNNDAAQIVNTAVPQLQVLEDDLTALKDKATDRALIATIGTVTGKLENAISGLQQERNIQTALPNRAPAVSPASIQDNLKTVVAPVQQLMEALQTSNGPATGLVQQHAGVIQGAVANLEDLTKPNAVPANSGVTVESINIIDRATTQLNLLAKTLTLLKNNVNDSKLQQQLGNVTGTLEGAMTNMQQQREVLTSPTPSTQSLGNQNPGGINLSNEHLTLNVKVDGAGMPLAPQYQDKAMMNLNGLVSIIRSITPITQQNVPALYELAK